MKVLNIKFASIKKTRLGFEHHVEATFSTSIQKNYTSTVRQSAQMCEMEMLRKICYNITRY